MKWIMKLLCRHEYRWAGYKIGDELIEIVKCYKCGKRKEIKRK